MFRITLPLLLIWLFGPALSNAADILVPDSILNEIYSDQSSPSSGAMDGLTIVEYFDYLCPYCKNNEADLEKLLDEDSTLKIIYVDYPKHGPLSDMAARAGLASLRQGSDKFLAFHQALLSKDLNLTETTLFQTAEESGLDVEQLKKDMADPELEQQLQERVNLGKSAGVRITPTFIIGGHLFPGFNTYDNLKKMVDYVRSTNSAR